MYKPVTFHVVGVKTDPVTGVVTIGIGIAGVRRYRDCFGKYQFKKCGVARTKLCRLCRKLYRLTNERQKQKVRK